MNWTLLHSKLHTTLKQRQLLPQNERLLVAVSGGQDSLCLLKLLVDLKFKWHWEIAIAHCDHRWTYDQGMAAHVEEIARSWLIPFYLKTADQLKETEATARQWRYEALKTIAKEEGFSYLVTAHTMSDRAETFLYNLLRGAGSDGISALTWQRFLTPNLLLIRPLLEISRAETYQLCQQFNLPIWEDRTNQSLKYARNKIRLELLPYLQNNFNPQIEKNLAQSAELLRCEVEYLEEVAQMHLKESIAPDKMGLNRIYLQNLHLILQRRVIRQFLSMIMKKHPNFEQVEAIVNLIKAPNRSRTSSLYGGKSIEVQGEWLRVLG